MAIKHMMEGQSSKEEGAPEVEVMSMNSGSSEVRAGMTVNGSDGLSVGHVTQVHPDGDNFLLERPGGDQLSIWVPLESIRDVGGDQITLGVPSTELEQQGWDEAEEPGVGT